MGLFRNIKNRLEISRKVVQLKNPYFFNTAQMNIQEILNCLNKLHATNQTAKSRVTLINHFGQFSDVNISFAYVGKKEIRVSDGLSQLLGTKSLTVQEWNDLAEVCLQNRKCPMPLKTLFILDKQRPIFLMPVDNVNTLTETKKILEEVNKWSSFNYPLVVGMDQFNMLADISSIELLSSVLSTKHLKYIFYYRGTSSMDFLDIPQSNFKK
jgi:hypothetical protein